MLTLLLIDDQYVQNAVLNFEKTSNDQNHSSDSHQPTKKFPQQNFPFAPTISKPLNCPFAPKDNFLRKLPNISITFAYLLFSIILMCFIKNP